jgi:hypothetical protein
MQSEKFATTPDIVGDDEILLRHLIHKEWIKTSKDGPIATTKAFDPVTKKIENSTKVDVVGLSVTRRIYLNEQQIATLGHSVVNERLSREPNRSFNLLGTASVEAIKVCKLNLSIKKAEPPQNHADIINWPSPVPKQHSHEERIKLNEIVLALTRLAEINLY